MNRQPRFDRLQIGTLVPHRQVWEQIIHQWGKVNDDYSGYHKAHGNGSLDLPYWYNEWSSVGFIAGAVWQMEGIVLAEQGYRPKDPQEALKRCDLWFRVAVADNQLNCSIEAKQTWPVVWSDNVTRDVRNALNDAHGQLKKIGQPDCGHHGFVLCFVVPEIGKGSGSGAWNETTQIFDNLYDWWKVERPSDGIFAAYRPPLDPDECVDAGKYYPGVVLIGEQTRWEGIPACCQNKV